MKRSGFRRGKPWGDRHEVKRKAKVAPSLVPKRLGKRLTPKAEAPWRCDVHKQRVTRCGCMIARHSTKATPCDGPVDPHHVTLWRKGWGQPSDALCVPLCRHHHNEAHEGRGKERGFEERYGVSFARWIERFSATGAAEIARILEKQP